MFQSSSRLSSLSLINQQSNCTKIRLAIHNKHLKRAGVNKLHRSRLRLEVRDGGVPVTIAVEFVAGIEEVLVTERIIGYLTKIIKWIFDILTRQRWLRWAGMPWARRQSSLGRRSCRNMNHDWSWTNLQVDTSDVLTKHQTRRLLLVKIRQPFSGGL